MEELLSAVALHNAGRTDEARLLYDKILQAQPETADAWHLLGMIYLRTNEAERALRYLHRALALFPAMAGAYNNLANLYGALENQPAAAGSYARALRLDPFSLPTVHLGYAALLPLLGDSEKAVAVLRRAAAVFPDNLLVWTMLCYVAYRQGDYLRMAISARTTTRIQPTDAAALMQVGKYFIESGQFPAAHLFMTQAVSEYPHLVQLHTTLAHAEALVGDKRRALVRRWRTTNFNFVNLPQELLPESTVDTVLETVAAALPASLQEQGCLVYPFTRINLIGHLAFEPLAVKQLHGQDHTNIAVITPPLAKYPKTNKMLLEIVTKNIHWVECNDTRITSLSSHDIGHLKHKNIHFLFHTIRHVERSFYFHCMDGGERADVTIPASLEELGRQQHQALGIPFDAPIVVIHMRESGYHAHYANLFAFRDVMVKDYIDTLRYLTRRGYFVVRIGDASMTRLPDDLGPQVIDAPFHPAYHPHSDIYFISKCRFMLSSLSGPDDVARMFRRPVLALNVPFTYNSVSTSPFELFAFKRYFDLKEGQRRYFNCREALDRGVHDMAVNTDFNVNNIGVADLTAEQILATVQEMDRLLERGVSATEATPGFRALAIAEDERRRTDPTKLHRYNDWFGHGRSTAMVPDSYCEMTGFMKD